MGTSRRFAAAVLVFGLAALGPERPLQAATATVPLRLYHSPYAMVNWDRAMRLKAQLHDHIAAHPASIRAYDAAGYQAVSLMDYSGAPTLPYALRERLWPPEKVGLTASFTASLRNIRLYLPNAEEVGDPNFHMTSPFLTAYIEKYSPGANARPPAANQYVNPQDLINKIAAYGGIPLLAHPWNDPASYLSLHGFRGIEVYSAFAEAKRRQGEQFFTRIDRNAALRSLWDRLLAGDQSVLGIAVNDHFGPDPGAAPTDPDIRDSGKIIVYAASPTLADFRKAFEDGAFVAAKDIGAIKDQYPALRAITTTTTSISIDTDGGVAWIANGAVVAHSSILHYGSLPPGTTYVRAEISNSEGSTLFTQAFKIRPQGDANGDGVVDAADRSVCTDVAAGTDRDPDHMGAC